MNSERFILEAAFPNYSNVSSKQTCIQKPYNHVWRSKLLVAFVPPVLGSYFEPMWCASNRKVRMKMLGSGMAGSYFSRVQLCWCIDHLAPLPVWVLGLLFGLGTAQKSSIAPSCKQTYAWCPAGGTRRGSDEEKWASYAQLLEQETGTKSQSRSPASAALMASQNNRA